MRFFGLSDKRMKSLVYEIFDRETTPPETVCSSKQATLRQFSSSTIVFYGLSCESLPLALSIYSHCGQSVETVKSAGAGES